MSASTDRRTRRDIRRAFGEEAMTVIEGLQRDFLLMRQTLQLEIEKRERLEASVAAILLRERQAKLEARAAMEIEEAAAAPRIVLPT